MVVLSEKKLNYLLDKNIKCVVTNNVIGFAEKQDVEAIVCCRATAARAININFPKLRLIQLTSAGFDGVPVNEYAKQCIAVANAGDVYSVAIAETIVYGMLMIAKRYRKNPNNHILRLTRGYKYITELFAKNVLIMGAGRIGTETAVRLNGFGMNVYGYDPYCADKEEYVHILRNKQELQNEINKFDYIVSTMPDTTETKGFINKELICRMRSNSVFVNVGRRAAINETDLYNALKNKQINAAVLDMFEKLPNPITNKFRRLKNVIVLPGVAAISREVNERLDRHICNNIVLLSENRVLNNIINEKR